MLHLFIYFLLWTKIEFPRTFKKCFCFFCQFAPFGYLYFSYFSMSEPELGARIDPGMAFNPLPSSILYKTRPVLNPKPLDRESSPLTTKPDLCPISTDLLIKMARGMVSFKN